MTDNLNTAIIIPVYNEAEVVESVVDGVTKTFPLVVCVNDGSTDNSAKKIKSTNAVLVNHFVNLGQGAALQTGIEYALQDPNIKYFVTFDSDGQHSSDDVKMMLQIIKDKHFDIVLGSRFLGSTKGMTKSKKVVLKLAIWFTNKFSNVKLTDTHNGLRVFNRKFAEALEIKMPGMSHASEIIDFIGRGGWAYTEAPITITYTEYSRAKGQSIFNSINILFDLVLSKVSRR